MGKIRITHLEEAHRLTGMLVLFLALLTLMVIGVQNAYADPACHKNIKNIKVIKENKQVIVYKYKTNHYDVDTYVCNKVSNTRLSLEGGDRRGIIKLQGGYVLYYIQDDDADHEDELSKDYSLAIINTHTWDDEKIETDYYYYDHNPYRYKYFFSKNRRLAWVKFNKNRKLKIYTSKAFLYEELYFKYYKHVLVDSGPIPIKSIKLTKSGVLKWKKNGESKSQALEPYDFVSG